MNIWGVQLKYISRLLFRLSAVRLCRCRFHPAARRLMNGYKPASFIRWNLLCYCFARGKVNFMAIMGLNDDKVNTESLLKYV